MAEIYSSLSNLSFLKPNPALHAPTTLSWFESSEGHETLLLMGNAENEITKATLESETEILEEFVELENTNKQITWMIEFEETIIGVAWIELTENHNVMPPSVHLMIGDKKYRGRGVGSATMRALIQYVSDTIDTKFIYSRYLKSNLAIADLCDKLGFVPDGVQYLDENNLEWQNVKLVI